MPSSSFGAPPVGGDDLLNLGGDRVTVYYSPGNLDRAARVQERFQDFCIISERGLPGQVRLQFYVLSRADWGRTGSELPYGLPVAMGSAVALPAEGDAGTVELWGRLSGGMMPIVKSAPMRGTPQEAASLVLADLAATSLAARQVLDQAAVFALEPWLDEVLAHAVAMEYSGRREPVRANEMSVLYGQLQRIEGPEPWIAGLARSAWHFQGGAVLAREAGKRLLSRLMKDLEKGGGRVSAAQLSERYPGFGAWVRGAAP